MARAGHGSRWQRPPRADSVADYVLSVRARATRGNWAFIAYIERDIRTTQTLSVRRVAAAPCCRCCHDPQLWEGNSMDFRPERRNHSSTVAGSSEIGLAESSARVSAGKVLTPDKRLETLRLRQKRRNCCEFNERICDSTICIIFRHSVE